MTRGAHQATPTTALTSVLYVAGPMTGYLAFNYPAFNSAARRLRMLDYAALNPADVEQHNTTGAPQPWDWYMRHALRMLLDGWEESRGAQLEVHVARALGIPLCRCWTGSTRPSPVRRAAQ